MSTWQEHPWMGVFSATMWPAIKWTLSRGFLVATCLTLLAQSALSQAPVTNLSSLYAPADEWTDASKLDWIPAQQVTMRNIYVPQSAAEWTYNHNPGIVEFNGTLFLGWHQGWKSEDNETQFRVVYAVSTNGGLSWSGMRIAVPDPDGTGPNTRFFSGFWVRGGELYMISNVQIMSGGIVKDGVIELYHWNASTIAFEYVAPIISGPWCSHGHNVLPIADGRYIIPIHSFVGGEKAFLIGGVSSVTNFVKHTFWPGPKRFSEHSYYQLPDGNLMFYFREYSTVKRLYRAVISPDGTGLQGPVVTDCPDMPSRQHASRWPGGKYYIVGSLDSVHLREYLVYTESEDGWNFTRGKVIARCSPNENRWPAAGKGEGLQYPDATVINGKLYVPCSRGKEDIRLYIYDPVPFIDVVYNADDPDTAPTEPTEAATAVFTCLRTADSPIASNTTSDLAHGITPVILTGSPHALSDGIGALTDGGVGLDGVSVGRGGGKFSFTNSTSAFRFRISLPAVASIGAIRSYSWHKYIDSDNRAHQKYRLYASDGTAPDFNQDDPASAGWTDLGHVDSRAVLGNTDGQVAVQITPHSGTAFGAYRHFIFEVEPDNPGDMWNHTYYTEINILEAAGPAAKRGGRPISPRSN